jgi:hypothetical protein
MRTILLLIFFGATLLTEISASHASGNPSAYSLIGSRRIAGGGKLCQGKLTATYTTYTAKYTQYSRDLTPILRVTYNDVSTEEYYGSEVEMISVNGRSILVRGVRGLDGASRGQFAMDDYRFKGSNRVYGLKGGDRIKAVIFYRFGDSRQGKKDTIECTIPSRPDYGDGT